MSDTFSDLFFGLNPQQLKAVKENDKPLLIIAGAGSGKTKVITTKVINLIRSGVKPSSILALTFTKKAAEEMLNRVMAQVGEEYDLQISPFHFFCTQFLTIMKASSEKLFRFGTLLRIIKFISCRARNS